MMRRVSILLAAILVFAGAFLLRGSTGRGPGEAAMPAAAAPLPKLVDLGSDKCIPCKQMAPILEELSAEYAGSFAVEFIDVWADPDAGKPYDVRVIPTQVFLDATGAERYRHEGFLAKDAILAKWRELGVTVAPARRAAES